MGIFTAGSWNYPVSGDDPAKCGSGNMTDSYDIWTSFDHNTWSTNEYEESYVEVGATTYGGVKRTGMYTGVRRSVCCFDTSTIGSVTITNVRFLFNFETLTLPLPNLYLGVYECDLGIFLPSWLDGSFNFGNAMQFVGDDHLLSIGACHLDEITTNKWYRLTGNQYAADWVDTSGFTTLGFGFTSQVSTYSDPQRQEPPVAWSTSVSVLAKAKFALEVTYDQSPVPCFLPYPWAGGDVGNPLADHYRNGIQLVHADTINGITIANIESINEIT